MDEVAFGRYRLIALIGEGGMGKVYKAHDTMMDRDVAIKVLPPEIATEPGYEQRFKREASTAARLTEPHIIPIHEAGEIDGRLYLVMPVIDGIDVHTLLQRDGPMSPQRAVHVIEQLAAALDAAHEAGLVHRDIKPSNALMTRHDFVYLIDFGIAHDAAATRLTSTGMMVGTLAYMAPERFTAGIADARSDVYALACVLHECLTGTTPYPGDSMEQQIAGHLTLDPPRPSEHRPDVPVGFDAVVGAGMAKKPDDRYQSARELATAAHDALTGVPAPAGDPYTPRTLFDDPTRPAPAPAAQQQSAERTQPATQQRPPPAEPVPTTPPWWRRQPRQVQLGLIAGIVVILAAAGVTGYFLRRPAATSQPSATSTTTAPTTTTPTGPPPVAEGALDGLLLSPDQINTALGATGMTVHHNRTTMDDTLTTADKGCMALDGPLMAAVYAGSGWAAFRENDVNEPRKSWNHDVDQGVVLFSSARDAAAFFSTSAQQWGACSNRHFTKAGLDNPVVSGPVSNTNGTLSTAVTYAPKSGPSGVTCERTLTVASNVVIDVAVCFANGSLPQPDSAVTIARQIAAKVPT